MNHSGSPGIRAEDVWTLLTPYNYSAALAAGASFVIPAKTIIMVATLGVADKLEAHIGSPIVFGVPAGGLYGLHGCIYGDGAVVRFKNIDAGSQNLDLKGISLP